MELLRPIAFIDLETTGVSITKDRIISIAIEKIMPDGEVIHKKKLINPEIPIDPGATKIHGITDEMVKNEQPFHKYAKSILAFIEGCDIGGYNSERFDIPLLIEEFLRAGIETFPAPDVNFVDVYLLWTKKEPRDLKTAFKFFCNKELDNAHDASADIKATVEVFMAQLNRYPDIDNMSISQIQDFTGRKDKVDYANKIGRNGEGEYIFNFGKHKDKKLIDNIDYIKWMLKDGDFTLETKKVLKTILKEFNIEYV